MNHPPIAFVAEGKLYLLEPGSAPRLLESPFVQGILDRVARARQRNEWKSEGMAWQFSNRGMNPVMGGAANDQTRRIRFSGVTRGAQDRDLLYALDTDHVGGLFCLNVRENHEIRLFHRNQFRASDLNRHPRHGLLAFSLQNADGSANLSTLEAEGKGLREITEGDSMDEAPCWVDDAGKTLVFQSAGVGRNERGARLALGPYAIQKLNLESGELNTLAEAPETDYLLPHLLADGTLYCITRPYQPHGQAISPLKVLGDVLLFPFRLIRAVAHFLDFFSVMFSRKPLITAGGPPREGPDTRYMMMWGKVIDAEKALQNRRYGQGALVPSTWRLVRRDVGGAEHVLATGVLGFDIASNGSIAYTNGTAVFHVAPGQAPVKLCDAKLIERVTIAGNPMIGPS